jgi:hypothetical protein
MIAQTIGLTVGDAALAVSRLVTCGLVVDSGGWLESARSKLAGSKAGRP